MIVYLTTADTEILALSHAVAALPAGTPAVRALNPTYLDSAARDRLLDEVGAHARVVVVRLLGGRRAFEPGFAELAARCLARGIPFIACPGDQQPDVELSAACTAPDEVVRRVFAYLLHGGAPNLGQMVRYLADTFCGTSLGSEPPRELPWDGVYHPELSEALSREAYWALRPPGDRPVVGVLFYRAHSMSGNLRFVDALIGALERYGCAPLAVFCYSLKDERAGRPGLPGVLGRYFADDTGRAVVDCLISTLSFAAAELKVEGATVASGWSVEVLERLDVPVLQAIISTGSRARWLDSAQGLAPLDAAMNVAMPEFDGRIITVPISFKEAADLAAPLGAPALRYEPDLERVDYVARLAARWARLRRTPNREKRIALILSNYPSKSGRIGNAVGLDTPASVVAILEALRAAGYNVGEVPESGDALMHALIERCTYDHDFLTREQLAQAAGQVEATQYQAWFDGFPDAVRADLRARWGEPPGAVYRHDDRLAIAGLRFGNVFVGVQPPRGFGENPVAIYHSPDLAPTHHYVAFYRWLRDVFGAHAVVHVGKHGTLEWLPGKALGLSPACYPEVALADMPHFYPFIINNPGEGAQAKRRAHATIVDHLIPAMTTADSYNELTRVEQLMDEYYQVQTLDPKKAPWVREQVWQAIVAAQLHRDLGADAPPDDFDDFLLHVDGYLCELKSAQIRDGLHILGRAPEGEQLVHLLAALTRLDNVEAPSLRAAVGQALGLDATALAADRAARYEGPRPPALRDAAPGLLVTNGDALERLDALCLRLLRSVAQEGYRPEAGPAAVRASLGADAAEVARVLTFIGARLVPALARTGDEIANLLRGLDGRYVPAGPSGAPTRGLANVLPTGRNFYTVDPKTIPSPAAWQVGQQLADALLEKYLREEGAYPETVGIVIWGTSAMRTHGDDVAEVLALLGVRPRWQPESRRVVGLEVVPLAELGRPRIDVTARVSGFFRDAFPNLIHLMDEAIERVATLDEPDEQNYVAKHFRQDLAAKRAVGEPADVARRKALYRLFGSKPGTYGAGILPLLDERNWQSDADLARVYATWGGYAYTRAEYGAAAAQEFNLRFAQIAVAAKNQDNREHDIFDSDDYLQYHGGMIATVRALAGRNPRSFFGDSADPAQVRVRDLADEARRVFRSRVVNPKWIASVKRHGYKGAFELAATVDYLFGYDATAQVVDDWMYQRVAEAYVLDPDMQRFFAEKNPWAMRGIVERLLEAMDRGLWAEADAATRAALQRIYLDFETHLEARQERR